MTGQIARKAGSFILCTIIFLGACSASEAPLVASDVEITKPLPGSHMSAGFLVLTNNTDTDIRITSATSPQFGAVQIHETKVVDGIARMREIEVLEVPARGSVTLERGGKHLMLMRAGEIGDSVSLQLSSDGVPVLTIAYTFPEEES